MNETNTQIGELTFVRSFDAPRQLVFECMTTAEHLTHFWGPIGVTTPLENITIHPRAGGVFDTIMVNDSDGAEYPMHAVFVEVDPPNKLVFSEADVQGGMTTCVRACPGSATVEKVS